MYLARRDLRCANGRFALMGGVVALITLLLVPQSVAGAVLLGLAGAALAVRSITRVDPLLALGGN